MKISRNQALRIALTDAELEVIRDAAAEAEVTMADWARGLLVRQAQRVTAGLGVNLDLPPAEDPAQVTERAIDAALAIKPRLSDPAIADRLNLTVDVVRRHREARGVEGVAPVAAKPWEAPIRAAHAQGLATREIAESTGYSYRSVQQYLSELGLKAHRK